MNIKYLVMFGESVIVKNSKNQSFVEGFAVRKLKNESMVNILKVSIKIVGVSTEAIALCSHFD